MPHTSFRICKQSQLPYPHLAVLSFIVSLVCTVPIMALAQSNGDHDVVVTYDRSNSVTLDAGAVPPVVETSKIDLTASNTGTEESQCRPKDYGRRSSATASISTNVALADPTHLTALLRLSVIANGGHYRTCVAGCDPIGQNCLGIVGHDTKAESGASTNLQAKVAFGTNILQDFYDLKLSSSLPNDLKIKITSPNGTLISPEPSGTTRLNVKPNDIYYVEANLAAQSSNQGGCCSDSKTLATQFDLQILKPAILDSKQEQQPYIVGGVQTSSYKYVAAILLRGRLHCSGTVVGAHTILTAAHCINGFEDQIKDGQMAFLLGTVITNPQYGPKIITDAKYPRGTDSIHYNPATYEHDVGLLYTSDEIPAPAAQLHQEQLSPQWSSIINKRALIFVGFGYNKSNAGDLVGAGVKREAPWEANKADDWRFYFKSAGHNTCSGDSGGPSFYLDEQTLELLLVGITSVGDRNCTYGADTRMDAHYSWASKLIK
jgi:secreted trypsin-like serine protease